MRASLSPRVPGLVAIAGLGAVAGLASGRPELVVVAAPFLLLVAVGLAMTAPPRLAAEIELERDRILEREQVSATVTVHNQGSSAAELELALGRTRHLGLQPGGTVTLRVAPMAAAQASFTLSPHRWGSHAVGPLLVSAQDPLGVVRWRGQLGQRLPLRAFPGEERLRELVMPLHTQPFLGTHVALRSREGIEFADIRPFAAGDRVRQVNWRATARRGTLYVTERHPEHASDTVLLLDTFAEAREAASGTLDAAVRAAASLARAHLARRDRVALLDFGGTLHWLQPAFGTVQLYRIIDALLASEIAFSYAWRAVDSIPRRVLPPGALVVAITPLLDERSIRLVMDLRTRGCDLAVIEVSPLPYTTAGSTPAEALGYTLWKLQREALRARLQGLGIAVATWERERALGPALEGVNTFRRSIRHAARA